MVFPRRAVLAAVTLLGLGGCASVPKLETSMSGAVSAGGAYALVDGSGHFGSADLPFARIEPCLTAAGLAPGTPATVLVQLADVVRPAQARLIRPGDTPTKPRRLPAGREREELAVTLTDPASGAVLMRAKAARILARGEHGGNAAGLADAVCALIAPPGHAPAAMSR